jgi:dTDP-glucose pyrophosphorylase
MAGYTAPKPFIKVLDRNMLEWVYATLPECEEYIFAFLKEHCAHYDIDAFINKLTNGKGRVVAIDKLTRGAAETALMALDGYTENEALSKDLLIVNSDQYIEYNEMNFDVLRKCIGVDGVIFTFNATHPKWSFAEYNANKGKIVRVAEKEVISDLATTGNYYFKYMGQFRYCAKSMIKQNIRTNGEFYLCPVYNELIKGGFKAVPFMVDRMLGMGTPEDVEVFKRNVYK